jgi:hypothetical protein
MPIVWRDKGKKMNEADKEKWLNSLRSMDNYKKFTDNQWECCKMIFDIVGGEHHLYNKIKSYGDGIEYNTGENFATFDGSRLTTAVFMAHDRCIRLAISSSGRGLIRICLWKRKNRDGNYSEKHPTLDKAIATYRESFPKVEIDYMQEGAK